MDLRQSLTEDKWFAAVVVGEAILILFGIILAAGGRLQSWSFLVGLTAIRMYFLWGLATHQQKFHIPYLIGAALFFLVTWGRFVDMYYAIAGYARYGMTPWLWLIPFAWIVRITGVAWCVVRGQDINLASEYSFLPACLAVAILVTIVLAAFTPLIYIADGLIYGIQFESM